MDKVLLSELTWPEVEQLLESGEVDTAVIAVGATEQHGHHLPLGTDAFLARAIGERVTRGLGKALLAPPITVGRSDHHTAFPGTISLRRETLSALLADYVASLTHHGFKNIVLIPTHGGNFGPLSTIARGLRDAYPQAKIVDYTDLDGFIDVLFRASAEYGVTPEEAGGHSGESETSLMLAVQPDLVRMSRAKQGYVGSQENIVPELFARGIGALSPDGVLGDPRTATAEKGHVYLQRIVDHLVEAIASRLV